MNELDKLDELFKKQVELQTRLGNTPFKSQKQKQEFINIMTLAAIDELLEAVRETQFKPWKKTQTYNEEKFKEELVDAWHFLINLSIASGMDSKELYDRFINKNKENNARQDRNY